VKDKMSKITEKKILINLSTKQAWYLFFMLSAKDWLGGLVEEKL
jgi:hypothetical protein